MKQNLHRLGLLGLSAILLAGATARAEFIAAVGQLKLVPSFAELAADDKPDQGGGAAKGATVTLDIADGKYSCILDTTAAPELTDWANSKIAPVVKDWYPKIVQMLPSDGFEAPKKFSIAFTPDYKGVAATSGTKIVGSSVFFTAHQADVGAIVHEMVHVVQQYGRARRANPNAERPPGWLVEGIPDYLRWYKYEPQSHGADIRRSALVKARFNGSYRISANFLNYVTDKYDKDLVVKLNAALRDGKYESGMWKTLTGKTVDELNDEWKAALEKQ